MRPLALALLLLAFGAPTADARGPSRCPGIDPELCDPPPVPVPAPPDDGGRDGT